MSVKLPPIVGHGVQMSMSPNPAPIVASNSEIEPENNHRNVAQELEAEIAHREARENNVIDAVPQPEAPKPTGISWPFLMMTLLGTRLGAGIVGVPYSTMTVGYVFAVCFQALFLFPAGMLSIWFLLTARQLTNKGSLTELGMFCFGTPAIYIINCLIALAQLGYPIIFMIVFGDVSGALIKKAHGSESYWSSRWFTHPLLGFLLVYLVIQKDISKLKVAGLFILSFITVFLILFFIHYLVAEPQPEKEVDHAHSHFGVVFIGSLPTFITVYTFQTTLFPAFATLKVKTKKNGQLADFCGRIIAFLVYNISPLLAFAIFGKKVEKNMLKSISKEEGALPIILMFVFLVIAVMHIPLIFYTGKEAVLIMIEEIRHGSYSQRNWWKQHHANIEAIAEAKARSAISVHPNNDSEHRVYPSAPGSVTSSESGLMETPTPPPTNMKAYLNMGAGWYYGVTLFLFFMVTIISIVVGDVSVFFGIIGSLTGCFCSFFGPGSFYVFAHYKTNTPRVTKCQKVLFALAWVYFVGGLCFSATLLICVFLKAAGVH